MALGPVYKTTKCYKMNKNSYLTLDYQKVVYYTPPLSSLQRDN